MANDINIKLKLDGEKEMKSSLKDVNSELKLMQSELKLVETQSKGAANSEENLRAKVEALGKVSETAAKKQQQLAQYVEEAKKKQEAAKKAVDDLKASGTANAEEVEKAEKAYQQLSNRVNYWETELNKATTEQAKANQELDAAKGYLEEAEKADDHLAKSIDEYGKEVKDSTKETEGLNKQVAGLTKMEAVSKIADKLSGAFKQMNKAASDAAKEIDAGYDSIVKKTGATGRTLEGLKKSANDLFGSMPESMDDVGKAVGEVNTRFGATGQKLTELSRKFLQFASLNETDVSSSVDSIQKAMTAFGVSTEEAGKVLDAINKVGQNTGVNISTLTSNLSANAAAFKQMGLDIYGAAQFMGELEVSGADMNSVLTGLKKALKKATDEGVPLNEALEALEESIVNGTDGMDGLNTAYELFGTKSGAAVYEAVKNGQISFKDLADTTALLAESTDSLNATYDATLSSWDQAQIAQNNLKIVTGDLSEQFQSAMTPALEGLTAVLQDANEKFSELPEGVQTTIAVIAGIGGKALEVAPQVASLVTQITALRIAKSVSGSTNTMTTSLKGMGAAVGVAGAAIGIAAALYANYRRRVEEAAAEQKEFAAMLDGIRESYSGTHQQVEILIEGTNQYKTASERAAELEAMRVQIADQQAAAQKNLQQAETELHTTTEELTDQQAEYAEAQKYNATRIDVNRESITVLEEKQKALTSAVEDANATYEQTTADLEAIDAALAEAAAEEEAMAQSTVESETAIQNAKDASITKSGEELTAFENLSTYSQNMALTVAESISAMQESITSGIQSQINWFDVVQEKEAQSADVMAANLAAQIDALKAWETNLGILAESGIDQNLLQYLANMGPEGAAYVQAFVDAANGNTEVGLEEMNALWQEKLDLEAGVNKEAEKVYEGIGAMAAGSKDAFDILAEQLNVSAEDCGGNIALGLANGIKAAQAQAEEAAEDLGEDTVDSVAEGAQTASPSKATLATGKNVALGLQNGITGGTPGATQAAQNLGNQVVNGVKERATQASAQGIGQAFTQALITSVNSAQGTALAAGRVLGDKVGTGVSESGASNSMAAQAMINAMLAIMQSALTAAQAAISAQAQTAGQAAGQALQLGINNESTNLTNAGNNAALALLAGISAGESANAGIASSAGSDAAWNAVNGALGVDASGNGVAIGTNLVWGIANGIWNNQSIAITAAAQMAASVLAQAKATLKISSPSKAFEEIGKYSAEGMELGFNENLPDLAVDEVTQNVSMRLPDLAYYAGASSTVNEVRVYVGDRELASVLTGSVIQNLTSNNRAYLASNGRRY